MKAIIPVMNSIGRRGQDLFRRSPQCRQMSTYYDSQSGLHIPVHNEKGISIFLNKSKEETSPNSFVPAQFYKEDASSDMPDKLQALVEQGIHGLWLPNIQFPRDVRNLQSLNNIAPPNFRLFALATTPLSKPLSALSLIHQFSSEHNTSVDVLTKHVDNAMNTTIWLDEGVCSNPEPVAVASQLATIIDSTGGGDMIFLTFPSSSDEDDAIQLCEELMYLDVAGPTIKSRIIIESMKEEIVEETMLVGINKYVVDDESDADMIVDIAKWQGKEIR